MVLFTEADGFKIHDVPFISFPLASAKIISAFVPRVKLTLGRLEKYNRYMPANNSLLKFLTASGAGSRRKMADAIKHGRVRVNDVIAEDFRQPVTEFDVVYLNGEPVTFSRVKSLYLVMNKPAGVISTTSDEQGRESVIDIIPPHYRGIRLYPVGRLDRDSTGLLILTNDGELTNRLTHPGFEHEKEYLVAVEGSLKAEDMRRLRRGIELSDGITYPAVLKAVRNKFPFNYAITIHEGRNRQIRRMFEALGYRVSALKRVGIGALPLGDLREGEVRELTIGEVKKLFLKR
ncbi:MAG: pseudouridine synthase [Dehalococcoidia bacterium]